MRLNERAAVGSGGGDSLWHVSEGQAFFAGPLSYNAAHRHSAAVYLAGLNGMFRLRVRDAAWVSCRTAAISAGVPYAFDMDGSPLGVLYVEPNVAGVGALQPLVGNAREVDGALIGTAGEVALMRELYEDRAGSAAIDLTLRDLLAFSKRHARRGMDARVARVVQQLQERGDEPVPLAQLAGSVGLSASRFQHLFTREVGVPFRRYRAWNRLRAAIREITQGKNFTTAAHAAGFADQAHFSREFRLTFGAPASGSLRRAGTKL